MTLITKAERERLVKQLVENSKRKEMDINHYHDRKRAEYQTEAFQFRRDVFCAALTGFVANPKFSESDALTYINAAHQIVLKAEKNYD